MSKTFLFIGFSFSDPNLNYLLSRIRLLLGHSRRDHYCLLRKVQREDFNSQPEFDYARARQDLQVRDLRRYGIQGLLLDSYPEYTTVLQAIANGFRSRRVFVSGSAAAYAPFSASDAQDILRLLGLRLIEEGFDVVTGFGLGVGPYLLNGVLEGLEKSGTYILHDRVTLRPFPQGIADPAVRAARWREYRRKMISTAGIALFLFGNRTSIDGATELASGVREEFELAAEAGLALVPAGTTGYVAQELHGEVLGRYDDFYPNRPTWKDKFASLGESVDSRTLVNRLIALVVTIAKER